MGNTSYSDKTFRTTTQAKVDSGTNFGYSKATAAAAPTARKAHNDLDPKLVAGATSPVAGRNIRESRDSDTDPITTPVAIGFDVTGSMFRYPAALQIKLPTTLGILLRKGYIPGPQLLIGVFGDTNCDRVPLQVSQFEAGNEIDDALDNVYLEGGGGGNGGETSTIFVEFLARHTRTDAYDKRGKRGYAFLVLDERALDVSKSQLNEFLRTDSDQAEAGLKVEEVFDRVKRYWELFVLIIPTGAAFGQQSEDQYVSLLGREHVLVLEGDGDALVESVPDIIAGLIGVFEGKVDVAGATADMKDAGSSDASVAAAGKSLQPYQGRSVVARGEGPSDLVAAGSTPTDRL